MSARDTVLRRVREALRDRPAGPEVPRDYLRHAPGTEPGDREAVVELFAERVRGYGAEARRVAGAGLPGAVAAALDAERVTSVVAPDGLDEEWLAAWHDAAPEHEVLRDLPPLSAGRLDTVGAVVTTCAAAVADSGTVVLDGGRGQGRRAPTLLPDVHVCVVPAELIGSGLAEVVPRLDPTRPLTWFSGPSATVDIEMVRIQGVHGPRRLHVLVLE